MSLTLTYMLKYPRAIFYSTTLFGICFGLNSLQILTIPLWPFSESLAYQINSTLVNRMWTIMQFIFERVKGARVTFSGAELDQEESAIVLSNHQSWSDYYMVNAVAQRKGMLPYIRYFIKDSLKYLPFFGWGMYFMGMLFIKRNWQEDQKSIDKVFDRLVRNKSKVWLVSYLEGSRLTPEKLKLSQAFAESRNLPSFHYVLFPRTKGIVATINKLRNSHIEYVYDFTMAYSRNDGTTFEYGVAPDIVTIHTSTKLSPPYQFHVHVEKFRIDELPTDINALTAWVVDLFRKKDALLARMATQGWTDGLEEKHNFRLTL